MIDYNIDMDALQLVLNRYSCLLNTQSDFKLIWITTIGAIFASILIWSKGYICNAYQKRREKLRETGFGFYFKGEKGVEKDLIALDLENTGPNELSIDPKMGVYIKWKEDDGKIKCHGIDLQKNNIAPIPKGRSRQLNYKVELNLPQKNIINSKKFRVFIFTTRGKEFELFPSDYQLNKWGEMAMSEWKKGVEEIKDIS